MKKLSIICLIVMVFACAGCAIPPELAIIMGEWKGEDIYFKLDEYGDVECNGGVYEDVLYGVFAFRDRFIDPIDGEIDEVDGTIDVMEGEYEILGCYVGRLAEGDEGDYTPFPVENMNYTVDKIMPIVDPYLHWSEFYYFNLVSLDSIEGYVISNAEWIDEDGQVLLGESIYPFTAHRVRM